MNFLDLKRTQIEVEEKIKKEELETYQNVKPYIFCYN